MKNSAFYILLLLLPVTVNAHTGEGGGGFMTGLNHPVLGFDHLLAMVSVGVLSAQIGGKAILTVPLAFLGMMLVGGIIGMLGVTIFSVELGIAFSVFALGVALAAEKKLPVLITMIIVGLFAIFHGHAHGAEMPRIVEPVLYTAGFITGTAAIHIIGVIVGSIFQQSLRGVELLRFIGAGIAGIGFHLMIM